MVDSPRGRATSLSSSCTCRDSSRVGKKKIIGTALPFLIRPIRASELLFSSARPRSLVMTGMPNARVSPVPVRYPLMTSRPTNTGTKASAWTGMKLVIPLPDSTLKTFWVHPFLVQYGSDVEVKLGLRKSILDGTSTPSSSSSYDPSRRPPSTCCCRMSPRPPSSSVMGLISYPLPSASLRDPDRMPSRAASRSSSTVE